MSELNGRLFLMGIFGALIRGVLTLVELGLWIYMLTMVCHGLITLFSVDPTKPFAQFIHRVTSPVLSWLLKRFPKLKQEGIDFSPWAVILALLVVKFIIINPLYYATLSPRPY